MSEEIIKKKRGRPASKSKKQNITIRISGDILNFYKSKQKELNMNLSSVIRKALEEWASNIHADKLPIIQTIVGPTLADLFKI